MIQSGCCAPQLKITLDITESITGEYSLAKGGIWTQICLVVGLLLTLGFFNSCHCGVRKNNIPLEAPSSVTARMSNANMMTYGKSARKYDALPELFTPREMMANTMIHAPNKQRAKRQSGSPTKYIEKTHNG